MTPRAPVSMLFLLGSAVLWVGSEPYLIDPYPLPSVQLPGLHLSADTPAHSLHVTITGTYLADCGGGLEHLIITLQPNQVAGPEQMSLSFGGQGLLQYSAPWTAETSDMYFEREWDVCVDDVCQANVDLVFQNEGDADILLEPRLELDLTCHDAYVAMDELVAFEATWSRDAEWPFGEDAP